VRLPETKPVEFPLVNDHLYSEQPGILPLPIHRDDENVTSCWRIPWVRRSKVLLTGRVYLVVKGQTHHPLYIETEPPVRP
jgi:hypothetical protein